MVRQQPCRRLVLQAARDHDRRLRSASFSATSRRSSSTAMTNRKRRRQRKRRSSVFATTPAGGRIAIASEAEARFGRKVSWGARSGDRTRLFTTASVPVMTRLHLAQRHTLDTLVEAGVARSRSEALAWCVELVGRNETEWIDRLRTALDAVEQERSNGPDTAG